MYLFLCHAISFKHSIPHTNPRSYIQSHNGLFALTHTDIHVHTCTSRHTYTYMNIHRHTHIYHKHVHTHTHRYKHTFTHICLHILPQKHKRTYQYTCSTRMPRVSRALTTRPLRSLCGMVTSERVQRRTLPSKTG